MAFLRSLVVESTDVSTFVQYSLDNHAPGSTLVVCSTKDAFLNHLRAVEKSETDHDGNENISRQGFSEQTDSAQSHAGQPQRRSWDIPTLRLLVSARTLTLAFCSDLTHLRAYLAAYAHRHMDRLDDAALPNRVTQRSRILAVLNLIQLHRPTSGFSAQGLNRTIGLAVEAAHYSGSRLVMAECAANDEDSMQTATAMFDEERPDMPVAENPWDEEVSILNVTTKSFGAGERGWVGRTVKIRTVAERWCAFTTLPSAEV